MTAWQIRRPPGPADELGRWTLAEPVQLEALRVALQRLLETASGPADVQACDLTDRLTIVATELAGNALRHGRPPTVVALLHGDHHLILDVLDSDSGSRPAPDYDRSPGTGGLGLKVAERLAHEVGWYPGSTGKHVWARFRYAEN